MVPGGSGAGKARIPKGERINAEYKRLRPELWKIPIFWKRKRRQNMSEKVLLRRVWDEIQKDTGKLMVDEGLSFFFFFLLFGFFCFFWGAPPAYGGSQARGRIAG